MRVYLSLEAADLSALQQDSIDLVNRVGVGVTPEFIKTVDTDEADELDLIAAMAASDLSETSKLVLVVEAPANVVDAETGEVQISSPVSSADFLCLLIADVDAQEVSWFGVQEFDRLPEFSK